VAVSIAGDHIEDTHLVCRVFGSLKGAIRKVEKSDSMREEVGTPVEEFRKGWASREAPQGNVYEESQGL
jgi:hypothetical protein